MLYDELIKVAEPIDLSGCPLLGYLRTWLDEDLHIKEDGFLRRAERHGGLTNLEADCMSTPHVFDLLIPPSADQLPSPITLDLWFPTMGEAWRQIVTTPKQVWDNLTDLSTIAVKAGILLRELPVIAYNDKPSELGLTLLPNPFDLEGDWELKLE